MAHTANTCWDRRGDGHGPARAFAPITKSAARSHLAATESVDSGTAMTTSPLSPCCYGERRWRGSDRDYL